MQAINRQLETCIRLVLFNAIR